MHKCLGPTLSGIQAELIKYAQVQKCQIAYMCTPAKCLVYVYAGGGGQNSIAFFGKTVTWFMGSRSIPSSKINTL